MKLKYLTMTMLVTLILQGCAPVSNTISNQYKLESYSHQRLRQTPTTHSILVSPTNSIAGYQTEQMLYMQKPFLVTPFAKNAWLSPPSDMIYPLIMESLQQSGYFQAVASGPYADQSQYRLDTELLDLQQNFIHHPSTLDLSLKAVITNVNSNHVIASRVFKQHIPCQSDTPYGGVVAANIATQQLTAEITQFVVKSIN